MTRVTAVGIGEVLQAGAHRLRDRGVGGQIAVSKGDRDFALDVDIEIERAYVGLLRDRWPTIPVLGEELSPDLASVVEPMRFWAVDPLDGTVNYASGLPWYASSIALIEQGSPTAGGVVVPEMNELFLASKDDGATLNGVPLHVRDIAELRAAVVFFGDFSVGSSAHDKNLERIRVLSLMADRSRRIRMPGSAAIQLAYVASGRADVSVTMSNNPWDVAAGVLLVREAGGQVFDFDGSTHSTASRVTLACGPALKEQVLEVVNRAEVG